MSESLITLEEVDVDDLPPLARELVALIGFAATIRLIELRPGIPTYIPSEMNPDHWLALDFGVTAATALVKNYGGLTITPPNCKVAMIKIRHRNIRKTRAGGYSQTETALLYGLTPRQIRNIESNEPEDDLNLSLF